MHYYGIYGSNFGQIAKKIPGRTTQQVKDLVHYRTGKKNKSVYFSNEDDRKLMKLLVRFDFVVRKVHDEAFRKVPVKIIEKRVETVTGRPLSGFVSSRDIGIA